MDRETRNAIQRATQSARALLEDEVGQQLEGVYDIRIDGTIPPDPGAHLDDAQQLIREKLIGAVRHYAALGRTRAEAVADFHREAAFTILNRFVALKMLEARDLVQECVSHGDQSSGFGEFCGLAPGLIQLPDHGYRLYLESIFDEIGQEVGILFDRRDPSGLVWPRRQALIELLEILNARELASVWGDDETIGWVYQYFNSAEERRLMRDESAAPRNSRELAVRNQFFTPRYVVEFLVDNTLGRTWRQMRRGDSQLTATCDSLVPDAAGDVERAKKDPRDIKILDPACGSGHFLLYAFDLLETIYDEAWHDEASPRSSATGSTLRQDYGSLDDLHRALPSLILAENLFGVEIDPRSAQIAALALWLRAQRGYRNYGLSVHDRPPVSRTHIVVAEPMPGDAALVDTFACGLQPPLLGDLFRRMVSEMRLAGDLGSLLRVDRAIATSLSAAREEYVRQLTSRHLPGLEPEPEQGELDLSEIDDVRFFEEAEALLLDALRRFSESAEGGSGVRRWLFADDAAAGIAFIELARRRFDVVLMNPPFGKPVDDTYRLFSDQYSGYHTDIYLAFLKRALELAPDGLVGCITSRSFLVKRRVETARTSLYLPHLALLWDLGLRVMDDAEVESAAYILDSRERHAATFLDSRGAQIKSLSGSLRTDVADTHKFAQLPFSKIIWTLPPAIEALFRAADSYEPGAGTAREGIKTFADERFLRLPWEVRRSPSDGWIPFVKGGENSFFFGQTFMLLNRSSDGAELDAINEAVNGSRAQVRQASTYWFRSGATYSRRAPDFAARALPAGCIFSGRGPAILPEPRLNPYVHLAWLNSTLIRRLVEVQSNKQEYMTGTIKSLPWIDLEVVASDTLAGVVNDIFARWVASELHSELSPHFVAPTVGALASTPLGDTWSARATPAEQAAIDTVINRAYGIADSDIDQLVELFTDDEEVDETGRDDEADELGKSSEDDAHDFLSWALGVAFGRFDVRFATGALAPPPPPDPFRELPTCAPAVRPVDGSDTEGPPDYPLSTPADGVLVDDAGDHRDIITAVRAVFDIVYEDRAEARWQELAYEVDPKTGDLRSWVADRFFAEHLKWYSRNRRKAPLYWQLGTPSRRYSVWLYAHRVTKDTLFRLQSDVLVPKVHFEERRLNDLLQSSGGGRSTRERREIEAQEGFVEELRALLENVKRVAPLWQPTLDDGVVLTLAPLWRLVPQKAWQRELHKKWSELAAGDHDWTHLAMRLWPERVVRKCSDDRSVAIAHGLADVFWVEGKDGKWQRRDEPTTAVDDLVRMRTSEAMKDALRLAA